MKTRYTLLSLPAVFIPLALVAQGPLAPPAGSPAPVMKTLQQVEPRIDVATLAGDASSMILISAPGSYYLSGNVAVASGRAGIAIAAADVELDLGGFAITGVAGSQRGVELRTGANGVRVRHGSITGISAGPGVGVTAATNVSNLHLSDLSIRNCAGGVIMPPTNGFTVESIRVTGSTSHGLDLGGQSIATRCVVDACGGASATTLYGMRSNTVHDCQVTAFSNSGGAALGISGTHVQGCTVVALSGAGTDTRGISADEVTNCRVNNVSITAGMALAGINASGAVSQCTVSFTGNTGVGNVTGISGGTVTGCHVNNIGNESSLSVTGISSSVGGAVAQCTLVSLGNTNTAGTVTGISGGQVSQCRVGSLSARGTLTGISSSGAAVQCSVQSLTQNPSGSTGSVIGIDAQQVVECQVRSLTATTNFAVLGIYSYRAASGCSVSDAANAGVGGTFGYVALPNSHTVDSTFTSNATDPTGIECGGSGVVRGCSFTQASGIGIHAAGASCVVENNSVRGCTTGISVTGANGLVIRNRMTFCVTNIAASASSQTGPSVTATGAITSTNPWVNFAD